MTITFKDVGQGDSIVITWEYDGKKYAGIIDCKGYGGRVPTIDHLKEKGIQKIHFIIISHPHIDHYGGMLKLLEYCEQEKLPIKYFMTSASQTKSYLSTYEINVEHTKLLEKIYNKANQLDESNQIKEYGHVNNHIEFAFRDLFSLKFLSPAGDEVRAYSNRVRQFENGSETRRSQAANLFSTFILFQCKGHSFIFTSDCESETLERIKNANYLNEIDNILGIQVPHHGSFNNHYQPLWETINYSRAYSKAVISVGENEKYNHPHTETVQSFNSLDYILQSTNYVNGIVSYQEEQNEIAALLKSLDLESEIVEESNGDVTIPINI